MLNITNDGPLIQETNFWESEFEAQGRFYLSTNAKTFRLLVPTSWEGVLPELATGKLVVVSRPVERGLYVLELLFDDGSDRPYCIHVSEPQVDRVPPLVDDGRTDLEFSAWTQPRRGIPHEALRRPAAYRVVPRLPWARSWRE